MTNLRKDAGATVLTRSSTRQLSSSTTRKSPSSHPHHAPLRARYRECHGRLSSSSKPLEAQFVGSFNAIPDPDGPIRSMPLVFKYEISLCRLSQRKRPHSTTSLRWDQSSCRPRFTESTTSKVNLGGFGTARSTERVGCRSDITPHQKSFSRPIQSPAFSMAPSTQVLRGKSCPRWNDALGLYDNWPNPFTRDTWGVYTCYGCTNILDEKVQRL